MKEVECPKCGKKVSKRGLKSHQKGRKCKAIQKRKEYKEEGMTPVSGRFIVNRLKENDIDLKHDISGYEEGSIHNSGSYKYSYYMDEDKLEEIKEKYLIRKKLAKKFKKVGETKRHLLLKEKGLSGDEEYIVCEKKEKGKTKKRKFFYKEIAKYDKSVYNLNRVEIGEAIPMEEADGRIVEKLTAELI